MRPDYIPNHDRLLDDPYQREMDRRAVGEDEEEEEDESADEDGDDERTPIPCSKCGEMTTFDPVYQDLCYRCIRADNE